MSKSHATAKATKQRGRLVTALPHPSGENAMDDMSWKQRGLVLLSIVAMTLIGLAIKAPAGEQTRFHGPHGPTLRTATTSGNTTTFYSADGGRTGGATT